MIKQLKNKWPLFAFAILFIYLFVFRFFVLPSADDYFWGQWQGTYLLHHGFFSTNPIYDGSSNGRWLGNLLEIFTLHKLLLAMFVFAFVWTLLVWAFWQLGGRSVLSFMFGAMFIFGMPAGFLNNLLVWNAGFVNYVPAAALLLTYLAIYKNSLERVPLHSKIMAFITCLIGFTGGLFVEHITLYQVFVGVLGIYAVKYIFKQRVQSLHATYLIGAIIGFLTMFLHPSYWVHSNYRRSGFVPKDIIHNYMYLNHFWYITFNIMMILMICIAVIVIAMKTFKNTPFKIFTVILSEAFAIYYVYMYWFTQNSRISFMYNISWPSKLLGWGDGIIALVFLAYIIFYTCYIFRQDKNKYFVFFYLFSAVALYVPFIFIVSPINLREYFHAYLLLFVLATSFVIKAAGMVGLKCNWLLKLICISTIGFFSVSYMYKMQTNYEANLVRVSETDYLDGKRDLVKHVPYPQFVFANDTFNLQLGKYWKGYLNKSFWERLW